MPHTLAYKPNAREAVERLALFWSRKGRDRIFARMNVGTSAWGEFAAKHTDGPTECPDPHELAAFWDAHFAELAGLEDDSLPAAYPNEFDQGIYAAVAFGAPMSFNRSGPRVSSMAPVALEDISKVHELKVNPDAEVLDLVDKHIGVYADAARGKFGVAPYIVIDAMNFVVEARGATRAFLDTFDHPDETRLLMDFAFELNVHLQERVLDAVDGFMGGSFSLTGSWVPGRTVSFSVDAYHLAGPEFYHEWGEPHLQRLLDHFGGGALHIHSNGRHLLSHVAKLRNLVCIQMADEAKHPRSYDMIEELQAQAGDVPINVGCQREEFERDLDAHRLPCGVLYHVLGVPSVEEGNRLMDKVRAYRV